MFQKSLALLLIGSLLTQNTVGCFSPLRSTKNRISESKQPDPSQDSLIETDEDGDPVLPESQTHDDLMDHLHDDSSEEVAPEVDFQQTKVEGYVNVPRLVADAGFRKLQVGVEFQLNSGGKGVSSSFKGYCGGGRGCGEAGGGGSRNAFVMAKPFVLEHEAPPEEPQQGSIITDQEPNPDGEPITGDDYDGTAATTNDKGEFGPVVDWGSVGIITVPKKTKNKEAPSPNVEGVAIIAPYSLTPEEFARQVDQELHQAINEALQTIPPSDESVEELGDRIREDVEEHNKLAKETLGKLPGIPSGSKVDPIAAGDNLQEQIQGSSSSLEYAKQRAGHSAQSQKLFELGQATLQNAQKLKTGGQHSHALARVQAADTLTRALFSERLLPPAEVTEGMDPPTQQKVKAFNAAIDLYDAANEMDKGGLPHLGGQSLATAAKLLDLSLAAARFSNVVDVPLSLMEAIAGQTVRFNPSTGAPYLDSATAWERGVAVVSLGLTAATAMATGGAGLAASALIKDSVDRLSQVVAKAIDKRAARALSAVATPCLGSAEPLEFPNLDEPIEFPDSAPRWIRSFGRQFVLPLAFSFAYAGCITDGKAAARTVAASAKEVVDRAAQWGLKTAQEIKTHLDLLKRFDPKFRFKAALEAAVENLKFETPPYLDGTKVVDYVTTEPLEFVRGHRPSNQARSWVALAEDVEGLSAIEMATKFNIEIVPTQLSRVTIPAGTPMRMSIVGPNTYGPSQGAIQYEIRLEGGARIPESWFEFWKDF